MRILAISDTHEEHNRISHLLNEKDCVLIHAGDGANNKDPVLNYGAMVNFLQWFNALPAKYKIFVPGNHDTSVEYGLINEKDYPNVIFLINKSVTIDGIKFYGSPYTPIYGKKWAYNVKRNQIGYVWNSIPTNVDVLITHGPAKGHLDLSRDRTSNKKVPIQVGCGALLHRMTELTNLKAHIFGHVHDRSDMFNHGIKIEDSGLKRVNASITMHVYNEETKEIEYHAVNKPIAFEVE